MAYTYDDFVTAATGAGLLEKFTDDDLNIAKSNPEYGLSALKLQQNLQEAKTTEQQLLAQEAINQLRTSYGNMGKQTTGSFQYADQTEYQKLLDEVTNMGSFSYDAQKDPSYGALKKTYLREGDRAREDTLAKVSAATGGAPSSFAVTAAQQAGDYYATQFADKVPTLEQNAYQRYLNDFSTKLSQLGAMNTDREFDFNEYLKNYELQQENYNKLMALMTGYGYQPTAEELAAAGMSEAQMRVILGLDKAVGSGGTGGSYSAEAAIKQQQLIDNGYNVTKDGIWGPQSEAAWQAYQAAQAPQTEQGGGNSNVTGYNYDTVWQDVIDARKSGLGKGEIHEMINAAYQDGIITREQQIALRGLAGGR